MDHHDGVSGLPELNSAIGDIYEIAFAKDAIPRTLELLCRKTRSQSAIFCHRDLSGRGMEESCGIDPVFDAPMARLMHRNLLAQRTHLAQVDQPVGDTELVRPEEWRGNPLFEEVWKPAGMHRCLGVIFARDRKSFSSLGLFRTERDPRHGPRMHGVVALIAPHLRRAMTLRRSFLGRQSSEHMLEKALDLLALPVLIAESSGRIVHANSAGEAALRTIPHLSVCYGRLAAPAAADRDRLRALLSGLGLGIGGSVALGIGSAEPAWLLAAPLTETRATALGLTQRDSLGLIAIRTGAAPSCRSGEILRSLFDLSPAEAGLAIALGQGKTLAEAAAAREVAISTVRSQLKDLFAKTGASRQSELVRLITGLDQLRQ